MPKDPQLPGCLLLHSRGLRDFPITTNNNYGVNCQDFRPGIVHGIGLGALSTVSLETLRFSIKKNDPYKMKMALPMQR